MLAVRGASTKRGRRVIPIGSRHLDGRATDGRTRHVPGGSVPVRARRKRPMAGRLRGARRSSMRSVGHSPEWMSRSVPEDSGLEATPSIRQRRHLPLNQWLNSPIATSANSGRTKTTTTSPKTAIFHWRWFSNEGLRKGPFIRPFSDSRLPHEDDAGETVTDVTQTSSAASDQRLQLLRPRPKVTVGGPTSISHDGRYRPLGAGLPETKRHFLLAEVLACDTLRRGHSAETGTRPWNGEMVEARQGLRRRPNSRHSTQRDLGLLYPHRRRGLSRTRPRRDC